MNMLLVHKVAELLAQQDATETDFMFAVCQRMERLGYTMELHQRGIQGTQVCITKVQADAVSNAE